MGFRLTNNKWVANRTSFAGADIQVLAEDIRLGDLQAISVSVSREKGPIYVLGSATPVSFSRGKRGIAGTLQFAVFDREAWYNIMYGTEENHIATYARKLTEIQIPGMQYNNVPLAPGGRSDIVGTGDSPIPGAGGSAPGTVYGTTYTSSVPLSTASGGLPYEVGAAGPSDENIWEIGVAESYCQYPDQIMPFDISITGQNEYAQMTVARVFGSELLNMGSSINTDDLDLAETYTYIAAAYQGFKPIYWEKDLAIPVNRYLTFGKPGSLTVGGLPGEGSSVPWAPFVG